MNHSRRELCKRIPFGLAGALAASSVLADDVVRCRPLPPAKPVDVGPGRKFSIEGKVQSFPGNTVICHVPRPGAQFDLLRKVYEALRAEVGEQNLTWLPPESYHVTIFDGVTAAFRRPGDWPHMLPLDADIRACNQYVGERLAKLDLGFEPPIRFVVDDGEFAGVPTMIPLQPFDAEDNRRLRDLRDRVSAAIGVRHANHDSYRFHTSFAYYVRAFSPDEEANYRLAYARTLHHLKKALPMIELGAPAYCVFDNMYAFREQFRLKKV